MVIVRISDFHSEESTAKSVEAQHSGPITLAVDCRILGNLVINSQVPKLDADNYDHPAWSENCGIIVLKRLKDYMSVNQLLNINYQQLRIM